MRIIITKTQVWEEVVPENANVEDIVMQALIEDEPDYEAVEVNEG